MLTIHGAVLTESSTTKRDASAALSDSPAESKAVVAFLWRGAKIAVERMLQVVLQDSFVTACFQHSHNWPTKFEPCMPWHSKTPVGDTGTQPSARNQEAQTGPSSWPARALLLRPIRECPVLSTATWWGCATRRPPFHYIRRGAFALRHWRRQAA